MGFLGLFGKKDDHNKQRGKTLNKHHHRELPTEDSFILPQDVPTEPTIDERMQQIPDYLQNQAIHLSKLSKKGPLSFRILAFLGGLAMMFASLYGFLDTLIPPITFFSILSGIIIAIYTFLFGCIICALEGRHFEIPKDYQLLLRYYFRILDYTWGRGILYAFAGTLQITQADWMNVGVGCYMIFVSMVAFMSSYGAGIKLSKLRLMIDSKRNLRTLFDKYDKDRTHTLNTSEFAALCGDCLSVDVTYQELIACFNAIDKNDDDLIQWIEFQTWWTEWGMKHLHRNMQDVMV